MIIDNTISYVATDEKCQEIPCVKVKGAYGQERVYESLDKPLKPEDRRQAPRPRHGLHGLPQPAHPHLHAARPGHRPGHEQRATSRRTCPGSRRRRRKPSPPPTRTTPPPRKEIRDRIFDFYSKNYPEVYNTRMARHRGAPSSTCQDIYNRTVFPAMKVNWTTYPENIGHRNWPGCFRCHDGKHVSKDGKVLTRECTAVPHHAPARPHRGPRGAPARDGRDLAPLPAEGQARGDPLRPLPQPGRPPQAGLRRLPQAGRQGAHDVRLHHVPFGPGREAPRDRLQDLPRHARRAPQEGRPPGRLRARTATSPTPGRSPSRAACLTCHDDKKDHNAPNFCGDCHEFTGKA